MIKEEGECNEVTHLDLNEGPEQKLVGIDMSRIVSYPGFNAPSKFMEQANWSDVLTYWRYIIFWDTTIKEFSKYQWKFSILFYHPVTEIEIICL